MRRRTAVLKQRKAADARALDSLRCGDPPISPGGALREPVRLGDLFMRVKKYFLAQQFS